MKIKFSNSAIIAVILICMVAGAVQAKKFCEGTGYWTDQSLYVTVQVSFSTMGDCCTPTAGSAFVSKSFYFNGEYLGTEYYYISIFEAQFSMGCEYT